MITKQKEVVERDANGKLDLSRLRAGAEVTVVAAKIDVNDPQTPVCLKNSNWLETKDILRYTVKPEPIKVGDQVLVFGDNTPRTVLAVHENCAWLKSLSGALNTWALSTLEKIS